MILIKIAAAIIILDFVCELIAAFFDWFD